MADSYSGPARILDPNGVLLTVGSVELVTRPETDSWGGVVRMIANSAIAGKALEVRLEIPGGAVSPAALEPRPEKDGVAFSDVAGMGTQPF